MSKLKKIGFVDVQRVEEWPVGIDDCAQYPVFTPELLDLMRRHTPQERRARVARSVTFTARKVGSQG